MINFITGTRFVTFLDKLSAVSRNQTSTSYIDRSPDDVFDSPIGTVLVKRGATVLYRYSSDLDWTDLSAMFPYLTTPRRNLLESGINKNAMWIKNSSATSKTWKFLGYTGTMTGECTACVVPVPFYVMV